MVLAALVIAAALLFCVAVVVLLARISRSRASETPDLPAAPPPAPADIATNPDEPISPDILARIQQEVTAKLGPSARILSVKRLETPYARGSSWAHQGRVFVHSSHRTGDRPR